MVTASFHDGAPFTADDVKFSYDRARDPSTVPAKGAGPHRTYGDMAIGAQSTASSMH
ncbi:MAG TPA: ABC transporter substrate-binding protein [Candidatus Dormibacteraeota bacterium]|nr:ABC transporter substrate-binding protein [Candidatus Dormibacteraeota bacterium]